MFWINEHSLLIHTDDNNVYTSDNSGKDWIKRSEFNNTIKIIRNEIDHNIVSSIKITNKRYSFIKWIILEY